MLQEEHKEFIKKAKEEYKKIGYVKCPAFDGEKVYFNKHGFNHFVRKSGVLRMIPEQIRRLNLLNTLTNIISTSTDYQEYEKLYNKNPPAQFWSFVRRGDNGFVKVVVRQIGNGNKHFFSVMDNNHG